ncbi:MAG: biopolymer transporter ExbD [Undibacterium sp.]|nr:biopolymer transporter ExbD [Opitutaceae bacterium]
MFFVNVGLVVLFFCLFGSRFILAPGLVVDFQVPEIAGATAGARTTTHQITVQNSGQIFADDGLVSIAQLGRWLERQKKTTPNASLLVLASGGVSNDKLAAIFSVAHQAGFAVIWGALEPVVQSEGRRR